MARGRKQAASPTKHKVRLPCEYQGVGVNKQKVRVGLKILRADINDLPWFDDVFCEAELSVKLIGNPSGGRDDPNQETLPGTDLELDGTASTARYSVGGDSITISLQFNKSAISMDKLGQYSGLHGQVHCTRVGSNTNATADAAEEEEESEAAE